LSGAALAGAPLIPTLPSADLPFRSAIAGLLWPALPARMGLTMLALQHQFAVSERLPPALLRQRQLAQLQVLLDHAVVQVPYWRRRLTPLGFAPGVPLTWEGWRRIPVLRRSELRDHRGELRAETYPREHGACGEQRSSGSTGEPVSVDITELAQMFWEAITLRDSLWHRRDLGGTLAALRPRGQPGADPVDGARAPAWNRGIGSAFATGPSLWFFGDAPPAEQAQWLARQQPDYLICSPSNLRALLVETERCGIRLERLKAAITYSEQLPPDLRDRVALHWGVPLQDIYSCREAGNIALQCPELPHYHVQSETVLVEVVDERGEQCAPGATGRVLITPLHNFATPLLRYELGDHAEVGAPCSCGRSLPVLARILGRTRNMVRHADGRRTWPNLLPLERGLVDLPVAQYQLAQRSLDSLELRVVPSATLSPVHEDRLRGLVEECGLAGFQVTIRTSATLPRAAGKSEDFLCELPD
jgi:phenylacetate-CoA ligase